MPKDDYAEFHEFRRGSPMIALETKNKPFDKLVFIERDPRAASSLKRLTSKCAYSRIEVIPADANIEIPRFCNTMEPFDRAVVFLDPYATQVSWPTVEVIARTKKIDCWILFPLMAITRMMPRGREPDEVLAKRLDRIVGGRNYWKEGYRDSAQISLFGDERRRERTWTSEQIAERYKERLRTIFHRVAATSLTLRNSRNVPLFELFFVAGNPKGARIAVEIADHILKKW